jgi:hypothetical protein
MELTFFWYIFSSHCRHCRPKYSNTALEHQKTKINQDMALYEEKDIQLRQMPGRFVKTLYEKAG